MHLNRMIKKFVFCKEILFNKSYSEQQSDNVIIFDTSIDSDNLGDYIINDYCKKILDEAGITAIGKVATHRQQTNEELQLLKLNSLKIVTGTNILSSSLSSQWVRPMKLSLQTNVLLMGVGWTDYNDKVDFLTSVYYKKILTKKYKHSVRDRYTQKALNKIGIENVIYTGCPTMWGLTEEHCKKIPENKGRNVVCTITDYSEHRELDYVMLDILLENYEKVFFWPQGKNDLRYILDYENVNKLHILDESLDAYDRLLKSNVSLDYVGTRLHAGIRALNNQRRTIVIAIDNRAIEISKDTGLQIVHRAEIKEKLSNFINSHFSTVITLPFDSINEWKEQLKRISGN